MQSKVASPHFVLTCPSPQFMLTIPGLASPHFALKIPGLVSPHFMLTRPSPALCADLSFSRNSPWSILGETNRSFAPTCFVSIFEWPLISPWPPCPYITPHFLPLSLICTIFIWRVREELVCESTNPYFSTKKDLTPISRKTFFSNQNFEWRTPTHFKNFTFYLFHHFSFHLKAFSIKLWTSLHQTFHRIDQLMLTFISLCIQNP